LIDESRVSPRELATKQLQYSTDFAGAKRKKRGRGDALMGGYETEGMPENHRFNSTYEDGFVSGGGVFD